MNSTIKYCTISPTILEETFQLQRGFGPLTPTGALPLDPAGGKPPDPHVSPLSKFLYTPLFAVQIVGILSACIANIVLLYKIQHKPSEGCLEIIRQVSRSGELHYSHGIWSFGLYCCFCLVHICQGLYNYDVQVSVHRVVLSKGHKTAVMNV